MIIRDGTDADAPTAGRLHATEITDGFLSSLGPRFLARLYRRTARHPGSFLLVAEDGGRITGMAAGTTDVGALYRAFLVRDGAAAALASLPQIVRSVPRVVETLRYGGSGHDPALPDAELLAVAVDRDSHGRGVGRRLVEEAQSRFTALGAPGARVVAGATNTAALRLYRGCGFRPAARTEVHAGALSEVLAWP